MADEHHVVLQVDQKVAMKTLKAIEAEGWKKGTRHINQDYRVRDEDGKTAGKFMSWLRGNNEDIWVSDASFPTGKLFHFDALGTAD